ncbi:MAG: ABC transporter permease [Deltaproteobacteria bacterium]|nr:ABC transporter permease [Deltaproteobacteria bacterium]
MRVRLGAAILGAFVVVGVIGPWVIGSDGLALDLAHDLAPPAITGGLGRGEGGVDVVTALIWGARASLVVASLSTVLAMVLALALGVTAGTIGGRFREAVQRVVDVVLAFPSLLLALILCALLPPSPWAVVLALSSTAWAGPLRVLVGLAREVAARDHVAAARALGASWPRVVVVHVLPLLAMPVAIQSTQVFAGAVVAEASLAFLGLGPVPGTPPFFTSWGQQLDDGVAYLWAAPHLWGPPGACVFVVVVAAQLLAEGLARR